MTDSTVHAQVGDFADRAVLDRDGERVGTVFDVYVDQDTDQPEWLAVSTGLFGTKISFVPLQGVGFDDDDNVVVAFTKALVKDAPKVEADGQLSADEERALYTHYGRPYMFADGPASADPGVPVGDATSMLRSEEELSIGKHRQETGRVKLRKWVETENVQFSVPVERQMARVVRETVREGDTSETEEFLEGEQEVILSEEVVDITKRVVAKERIGLETETVTDHVAVDEKVRKERIDIDGDAIDNDRIGETE